MRILHIIPLLAATMSLMGACATASPPLVLDPVGPEPDSVKARRRPLEGSLIVYSALETQRQSCCDDYVLQRSGYDILTATGSPLKHVGNPSGENPEIVLLAPGHYVVRAVAMNSRTVDIPVLIARADTTVIHLDGSALAGGSLGVPGDLVLLPDGTVVGWRDKDAHDLH